MIKTDFKKPSLDLQLQNKSLLLFALVFTSIILINIFLEMINMNPYLHYILLLSLSGLTILFMDFSFSLVSSSFMSNKNLTITSQYPFAKGCILTIQNMMKTIVHSRG